MLLYPSDSLARLAASRMLVQLFGDDVPQGAHPGLDLGQHEGLQGSRILQGQLLLDLLPRTLRQGAGPIIIAVAAGSCCVCLGLCKL